MGLSPVGTANDDLIARSLTIKSGNMDAIKIDTDSSGTDILNTRGFLSIVNGVKNRGMTIGANGIVGIHAYSDRNSDPRVLISTRIEPEVYDRSSILLGKESIALGTFRGPYIKLKKVDDTGIIELDFSTPENGKLKLVEGIIETDGISYSATPNDKFREVWGSVNAAAGASPTRRAGSQGWTVARISGQPAGAFRITFSPAFPTVPIPSVNVMSGAATRIATTAGGTGNFIDVYITDTSGIKRDAVFNFVMRGPA